VHESGALGGLYMLKVSNGSKLPANLHSNALPEIASLNHKDLHPIVN